MEGLRAPKKTEAEYVAGSWDNLSDSLGGPFVPGDARSGQFVRADWTLTVCRTAQANSTKAWYWDPTFQHRDSTRHFSSYLAAARWFKSRPGQAQV